MTRTYDDVSDCCLDSQEGMDEFYEECNRDDMIERERDAREFDDSDDLEDYEPEADELWE